MFQNPLPLLLIASLSFVAACSNRDREQAAKADDGVASFRYQPPDMKKYSENREPPKESTPKKSSNAAGAASAPEARGK